MKMSKEQGEPTDNQYILRPSSSKTNLLRLFLSTVTKDQNGVKDWNREVHFLQMHNM